MDRRLGRAPPPRAWQKAPERLVQARSPSSTRPSQQRNACSRARASRAGPLVQIARFGAATRRHAPIPAVPPFLQVSLPLALSNFVFALFALCLNSNSLPTSLTLCLFLPASSPGARRPTAAATLGVPGTSKADWLKIPPSRAARLRSSRLNSASLLTSHSMAVRWGWRQVGRGGRGAECKSRGGVVLWWCESWSGEVGCLCPHACAADAGDGEARVVERKEREPVPV